MADIIREKFTTDSMTGKKIIFECHEEFSVVLEESIGGHYWQFRYWQFRSIVECFLAFLQPLHISSIQTLWSFVDRKLNALAFCQALETIARDG